MSAGMSFAEVERNRRARALDQAIRFYERDGASYGDVLIAARAFDAWLESGIVPETTTGDPDWKATHTAKSVNLIPVTEEQVREALAKVGLTPRLAGMQ